MPWTPKGETTIKADKDYKAGEEIKVKAEFTVDQGDLDRMAADRISREKVTQQELQKQLDDRTKELDDAKKAASSSNLSDKEKRDAELAELRKANEETQKKLTETSERLLRAETDRQVEDQVKALVPDLPSTYRKSISVKPGATAEEIKTAVEAVKKTYDEEVPEASRKKPAEKKKVGIEGNGGAPEDRDGATALAKLKKNRPDLLTYMHGSADAMQKQALVWDKQGKLEPKAAK